MSNGDEKKNTEQGNLLPALEIDQASKKRTDENRHQAVNAHDQPNAAFGRMELFEKKRKKVEKGDAHEQKEIPEESQEKIPGPECLRRPKAVAHGTRSII